MRGWSKVCWLSFGDWLAGGTPGMLPWMLLPVLGPVWLLLPRARQGAEAVGPWLLELLAARERNGQAYRDWTASAALAAWGEKAWQARPFSPAEAPDGAAWLRWGLSAELQRVVWLVEAPFAWLKRAGWPEAQVRYWALVASLARLGQVYELLARQQSADQARLLLEAAAEQVWREAVGASPQAA